VTTTSKQSVEGTKIVLEQILNSSFFNTVNEDTSANITLLLSMIPRDFDSEKTNNLIIDLFNVLQDETASSETGATDEGDTILGDIVIESKFTDSLIHLWDLEEINESLKGSPVSDAAASLAKRLALLETTSKQTHVKVSETERERIIKTIYEIANAEITAEGQSTVQMMATNSLEQLCRRYIDTVPRGVILGAKGSGKTYIYKQLLDDACWERFVAKVLSKETSEDPMTMIMPVLATKNRTEMEKLLKKCFSAIDQSISANLDVNILNKNEKFLQEANEKEGMKPTEWFEVWSKIFLHSFSKNQYDSFSQLDSRLLSIEKKIVFIIDGLEDIFNETIGTKNSQMAIKCLCQDMVNQFAEYKNIGILIFIRNDISRSAISVNYEQFEKQYREYALKWEQDEALRLVIWILWQAGFFINKTKLKIEKNDIPKLSRERLNSCLSPFWGAKLGRDNSNEAYSTRWIIAALSDLNLHIQARDIIRFLASVTANYSADTFYHDRILLPADIKRAIIPCSEKKREELGKEMPNIEAVFKLLENIPLEKKLPIKAEDMEKILDVGQRNQMEAQGYLTLVDKNYYIPEIIRHALGYVYAYGARPRVLALLQKN
jgi:hypothetical protein